MADEELRSYLIFVVKKEWADELRNEQIDKMRRQDMENLKAYVERDPE